MTDEQKNRILAEKVMGWHFVVEDAIDHRIKHEYWADEDNAWTVDYENWQPTHNISQALMCAEKWCHDNHISFWLMRNDDGEYAFITGEDFLLREHTPELAICHALLEAVEPERKCVNNLNRYTSEESEGIANGRCVKGEKE